MARVTIYEMSRKNLNDMTVKQLKDYIRKASSKIGRDMNSRYKAVKSSARYIGESLGTRTVKTKSGRKSSTIKLGFDGMRKKDLLARARLMQGHFKIDVYSKNAREYEEKVSDEAMENFYKNTGIRFGSKKEMADFKQMMSMIHDIVEKFGSDNIAKMYDEMNRKSGSGAGLKLGTIIREVYENTPKDFGYDQKDMMEMLSTYLEFMYDE